MANRELRRSKRTCKRGIAKIAEATKISEGLDGNVIELQQGWEQMQKGITKLKNILEDFPEKPFTSQEHMTLYTTIYNMCTQKQPYDYSKELYDKYKEAFEEYFNSAVLPSLREKNDDEFLLRDLLRRWSNHKVMTKWLSRFFNYLQRYYIPQHSLPSLKAVGYSCFRDLVLARVKGKVTTAMISLIHKEREGEKIDRSLLRNVFDFYLEIGAGEMDYMNDFESHMIKDTGAYYARKAANWIEVYSCPDYMIKAEESLKRERYRVEDNAYLHPGTEKKLVEEVQRELLVNQVTRLLEKDTSGLRALLEGNKVQDLSRMCRLYQEIAKGLDLIGVIFKNQITNDGTSLVQQAEEALRTNNNNNGGSSSSTSSSSSGVQEQAIVRKFIELHNKYMEFVQGCFKNNIIFHKALRESFEAFCSKPIGGVPSVELVATFCDNVLKKGGGGEKLSDEAIEKTLEVVISLVSYNADKDLFAEFYRKKLARRLLYDRSADEDHEKSFLSKLKQQFGAPYTSKMEGMITDLAIAKDNQASFDEYLDQNPNVKPGIGFSATVVTTVCWPSYKPCGLNLPSEMIKCVEVYNGFYESKTNHRKLSWIYSLGTCHINGRFQQKSIELVVSTYQAAALLLFNNADRLSFSEIMTQLGLDQEDLVRVLHSLSGAKYKILSKEPNTRTISPNDWFCFNSKFTDRMRRIKIALPPMDERNKMVEDVDKDRRFAIDAAIVRIMKSRKVLGHQQLVTECVEMMSRMFKPDIKVIKKRIDHLIIGEFIERDSNDSNTYKYLA